MSKGRNKKKNQANLSPQQVVVTPPAGMSSDEMQHVIAMAIVEAEEIKERKKQEQKEAERKEWRETIRYKEYDDKCKLWRGIKTFFNRLKCFCKVCVLPKKKIQGDRASFSLMLLFLQSFFVLAKWLLVFVTIASAGVGIYTLCTSPVLSPDWVASIYNIVAAIPLFLLSRLFRMASIEVEKIEDRNYLFGLFASVASIVSIVIAIIAIIKGD